MKRGFVFLLCFFIVMFCGCKNTENYVQEEGTSQGESSHNFSDYQYNQEKAQYYSNAQMAITDTGYYYRGDTILYKYDVDKDISIPMCSKAECNHNSNVCDAYVAKIDKNNALAISNCIDENVMYYNNHIYMIERQEPYKTGLMQYDENFNNKEVLTWLATDNSHGYGSTGTETIGVIADGYYYYFGIDCNPDIVKNGYKGTLYCDRVKLEKDAKREVLGEYSFGMDYGMFSTPVSAIYVSGDNIWFISVGTYRWYEKDDPVQCKVAVYNTKTSEFKITKSYISDIKSDIWGAGTGKVKWISRNSAYMDENNNLYMVSEAGSTNQIIKVNLIDNSYSVIYKSQCNSISGLICDGNNIFFAEINSANKDKSRIAAISLEGEVVASMQLRYEDSYLNYLKSDLERRKKSNVNPLENAEDPNILIFGTDERYIVIANKEDGIKGLSSGDSTYMKKTGLGDDSPVAIGVGLINKADFLSGKDCEIKQIYRYFDNH